MEDKLSKCIAFRDYLDLSRVVLDKVAFLTLVFKRLNPDATAEDLVNTGGRIARLWSIYHKDTGYLLKIVWDSSSVSIAGSHLNYIQGILNKNGRNAPLGQQRRAGVSDHHISQIKKLEDEVRNK